MADGHEPPLAGPFAVTTDGNGVPQRGDAADLLPTLIAFRVTPEGHVILHVTQSMKVPRTQESYYTRVFWVGPKALPSSLNERIREYFKAEEGHVLLKESLLSATLLVVNTIMGQDMFERHWKEGAGHEKFGYNTESSLYPMIGHPGGKFFPPGDIDIDRVRWDEQRHLTKVIEVASDPTHEAYSHWLGTSNVDEITLGSVSSNENEVIESYQGSDQSAHTGSTATFDRSLDRLSPTHASYCVLWNPGEYTLLSKSDNSEKSQHSMR